MANFKLALLSFCIGAVMVGANAQDTEEIREKVDEITFEWDNEAIVLNSYDGLTKFCRDDQYRYGVIDLLEEIHHYDSVLYIKAKNALKVSDDKELKKLVKDIEKFEKKYSMKDFIGYMRDDCVARAELERNDDDMKSDIGSESYDSQVYIIETELQKYVKNITKSVDRIREHVHHLVE
jgi:hypothetical protein